MKQFLILFAVLVLGTFSLYSQKPMEDDPYLLWQTTEGYSGFVIHPNGNIIAIKGNLQISELNGNTGEVIRIFEHAASVGDISPDGKFLLTLTDSVTIMDYETGKIVKKLSVPGSYTKYFPDGNRIIYWHHKALGTGLDSSIVIYNFIKDEYTFLDLNYSRPVIATSPDGKYFATGGTSREKDIMGDDVYYTILTLWDAETLKPIKELAKIGGDFEVRSIKFSPDGKYVGVIVGSYNLYIYRINDFNLYKHYNDMFENLGIIGTFCFLGNDLIVIKSRENGSGKPIKLSFINTNVDMCFNTISNLSGGAYPIVEKNPLHNSLIDADGQIYSYDLNKILTSVNDPIKPENFTVNYNKDTLILYGLNSIMPLNITISDISGKVIRKLNVPVTNSEIRIPLILPNGTYLIHVQDGQNNFSSKFLVME